MSYNTLLYIKQKEPSNLPFGKKYALTYLRRKIIKQYVKNVRLRVIRELTIKKNDFLTVGRYAVERRGLREYVRCGSGTYHSL